jgi:hypothetical protein
MDRAEKEGIVLSDPPPLIGRKDRSHKITTLGDRLVEKAIAKLQILNLNDTTNGI